MNGVEVASKIKGIIDTGTSLIVGSYESLGSLADLNIYYDCSPSDLQNVLFEIDGIEYELTPDDYVVKSTHGTKTKCINGFKGASMP